MTVPVGYFWNPALAQRRTGLFCPERPERCTVLEPERAFAEAGVPLHAAGFVARDEEILAPVHDADYVARVRDAHRRGPRFLDAGDTEVTPDVFPQALLAASAGCTALDEILAGRMTAAFCAVRPPGHHANRMRALGFCVFNNTAVAAAYARARHGVQRVLALDWDVHPGNGTQEIFFDDPSVFTLSIHQADLFPEAGREELIGRGAGAGFNRNVPVAPGTSAETYLSRLADALTATAAAFRPELLLIAAGFDAHRSDPASALPLEEAHFARMTHLAIEATRRSTGGRTLSLLEGGYSLGALGPSVAAHVRALHEALHR